MSEKSKIVIEKLNPINNRWLVVIGAILIQLALGAIYTWGAMSLFATDYLLIHDISGILTAPGIQPKAVTTFIFGIGVLSFAITMIFAGKMQQKLGPLKVAILGGVVIGLGCISSVFTAGSFLGLILTYGVIYGAGIGFAYVCPIACAGKWFPDKKGLINGLAVAGFGAGASIFAFVIKGIGNIADPPVIFLVLGIIYLIMIVFGALTLINPPEGWKPEGWEPPAPSVEEGITSKDFTRVEMVKTKQFWIMWVVYILSALPGLMALGAYSAFAKSDATYIVNDTDFLFLCLIITALFNAGGRIGWGYLADKINYKRTMLLIFVIQAAALFIYFATSGSQIAFLLCTGIIYACFGGVLALYPSATTDMFGPKNLSENYGVMFTGYGVAGFTGASFVTMITLALSASGYLALFILMGILSIIATILIYLVKPPK
ncbi:MAG: OFA family MFS transporter [Promethearchaeota archaeon]